MTTEEADFVVINDSLSERSDVFVCIVLHHSDLRPKGESAAIDFVKSWKKSELPFNLLVVDNTSDVPLSHHFEGLNHKFFRSNDQLATGGITGAWNFLAREAVNLGAKKIMGFSDDVSVNDSLAIFAEKIVDKDTLYGPLTDKVPNAWREQRSPCSRDIVKSPKSRYGLHGFWLGFTREFWVKRNVSGCLFTLARKNTRDRWGGQEFMIDDWKNVKLAIIGQCWIKHTKLNSWRLARKRFG